MADSNKPEWFYLSGNYFEETAIALGNSAYKDVKITLSLTILIGRSIVFTR